MKMPTVSYKQAARVLRKAAVKQAPVLLTVIGISSMVSSTVLAVRATPKAILLKEKAEMEKNRDISAYQEAQPLTPAELVRSCWRCYTPAFIMGVFGTACLIGANSVHLRRNAALAAAYALSETSFKDYKEKTAEVVGEKKETEIRNAVAKDAIEKNPPVEADIIETGFGNNLCYDPICGRYFRCDIEKLKSSLVELNMSLISEGWVSLNDYYERLRLPESRIGDDLGWNLNECHDTVQLKLSAQLADNLAQTPCMVIGFQHGPIYNYDSL